MVGVQSDPVRPERVVFVALLAAVVASGCRGRVISDADDDGRGGADAGATGGAVARGGAAGMDGSEGPPGAGRPAGGAVTSGGAVVTGGASAGATPSTAGSGPGAAGTAGGDEAIRGGTAGAAGAAGGEDDPATAGAGIAGAAGRGAQSSGGVAGGAAAVAGAAGDDSPARGGAAGDAATGGDGGAAAYEGLRGHYLLTIPRPPWMSGCVPSVAAEDLPFDLAPPRASEIDALVDLVTVATSPLAPDELVFPAQYSTTGALHSPELWLRVRDGALAGDGIVVVPYDCGPEGTEVREVPVTVLREDDTPHLLPRHSFPGPVVPAGGLFSFAADQGLDLPNPGGTYWDTHLRYGELGAELITALDGTTGEPLPVEWQGWPWGPAAALGFADYAAVVGRRVAFELVRPLVSFAGFEAVVTERGFTVVSSGLPANLVDFDAGPHEGAHGAVTYHPSGAAGSPCEAGGCLELGGPSTACEDWDERGPAAMLAFRLATISNQHQIRYRVRFQSSTDFAPGLWWWEQSACSEEPSQVVDDLSPLPEPDGPFTHASDWLDLDRPFCMGPETDKGMAIALNCTDADPAPEVRLLVERIEVVAVE